MYKNKGIVYNMYKRLRSERVRDYVIKIYIRTVRFGEIIFSL